MTDRFVSAELDLSQLPAPNAVQAVSYESILATRLASLRARFEAAGIPWDMDGLETDPATILQQESAYRETLAMAAINDRTRAVMLAFATGADLENLGAFYGVARMVITPASGETPAVMESDSDLRYRIQLAPEALPYAGMTGGGYRSLARKTAPSLKDVQTVKRPGGRVDVVLLSRTGNGAVDAGVVDTVYQAFRGDEATQLTDVVSVRSADPITYAASVKLRIPLGPDAALIRATAASAVRAYVDARHRVGTPVYLTGLIAAAKVGGVEEVVMISPTATITPGPYEAAFCSAVTITSEVIA